MYELHSEEILFFDNYPDMLEIYGAMMTWLTEKYEDITVKVGKTAISLRNRYVFATVSLPWRRVKGWPRRYILFSLGLGRQRISPRVRSAVEPHPNRWTHHILIESPAEFDADLQSWFDEAYAFSKEKP